MKTCNSCQWFVPWALDPTQGICLKEKDIDNEDVIPEQNACDKYKED